MIRRDFIKRKISLIQDDLSHLTKFSDLSFDEIAKDAIKQAAVERFLERIINRAVDINQYLISELAQKDTSPPKDYKETYTALVGFGVYSKEFAMEISKSVGTRNKLVHEYNNIDHNMVYQSIGDCLRDYHQYCDFILQFLEKQSE